LEVLEARAEAGVESGAESRIDGAELASAHVIDFHDLLQ
jgi:hypothetical protein